MRRSRVAQVVSTALVFCCAIVVTNCDVGPPTAPDVPDAFTMTLARLFNCPPDCSGPLTDHDLDLIYEAISLYEADHLEHCNEAMDLFEDFYYEHMGYLNGVPGAQMRFEYISDGYPAFTDYHGTHPDDTPAVVHFGQRMFEGGCSGYNHGAHAGKQAMHEFMHPTLHLHMDAESTVVDETEACWGGGGVN